MTASDYSVEFGYGAQDGYYYGPEGIVGAFHRGNDRYTPTGTSVVIGSTAIGKTGATGLVGGPHLHTQAGTDKACQDTFDPTPLDFQPGTVVATQTVDAGQWGKYITIQTTDGYITYAHLSAVNVSVGQVIGGEMTKSEAYTVVDGFYRWGEGHPPTAEQSEYWAQRMVDLGYPAVDELYQAMKKSAGTPDKSTVLKPGKYQVN